MKKRKKTKYVHEGRYVAKFDVELLEDDTGWAPYLSVEDAYKLDDVRAALRQGEQDYHSIEIIPGPTIVHWVFFI